MYIYIYIYFFKAICAYPLVYVPMHVYLCVLFLARNMALNEWGFYICCLMGFGDSVPAAGAYN